MSQKSDQARDAGVEHPQKPLDETPVDETRTNEAASTGAPDAADGPGAADTGGTAGTPQRRGPGVFAAVAGLAFLLGLAALGGVGYLAWQSRGIGSEQANTGATLASLTDNFDESLDTLDDLRERLADLSESDAAYGTEIDALERRLDGLLERYESIPARLTALESALTSLEGISTGARENWWLAEAEYYMQIANAQLQLAGNPRLARLALEFADQRVRQVGNPALTDVRRELARELRALESMEKPDVEGLTIRLASLADSVTDLPIEDDVARGGTRPEPLDPDAGALDRAMASVKRVFSGIVSVRRSDEQVRPLLSPDARYFLRANLALQMQTARLALLQNEREVFDRSLADAASWLRRYYDTDSRAVSSALATIEEAREAWVTAEPPDISGSLERLRRHRTLAATGGGAAGSPDTDAGGADETQ